jgi:E3 Ubiquitin ligase
MNYLSILSMIAIAGGLYFFVAGFQLLARKRLLLATPTSRIRSAALGLVEVNGMATGPHTIPAPITGNPCFLYHTTAWQQREGKKNDWEKVAEETLHLPFFLDDTTGKVLIEPLGADLDLHRDFREEYAVSFFSGLDDIPPRVSAFLYRHGVASKRSLRIEERSIKPKDPLFVTGTLMENPGIEVRPMPQDGDSPRSPRSSLRQALSRNTETNISDQPAPEIIRLYGGEDASSAQGMSQQAKIAAALTRAGITKPEAWSAAGIPYQRLAVDEPLPLAPLRGGSKESSESATVQRGSSSQDQFAPDESEPSTFILNSPVVLMKGENDSTFVISFRSQKEFVIALAWKSAGMVSGGTAIMLLGFYMLLAQRGVL